MKTTLNIIIATVLLAVATSATAKSWRINNNAAAAPTSSVSMPLCQATMSLLVTRSILIPPPRSVVNKRFQSR